MAREFGPNPANIDTRAAALSLMAARKLSERRIDVVSSVLRPDANGKIRIGTWIEGDDGSLFRFSTIPPGMTVEEAERTISQPGWKPTP